MIVRFDNPSERSLKIGWVIKDIRIKGTMTTYFPHFFRDPVNAGNGDIARLTIRAKRIRRHWVPKRRL